MTLFWSVGRENIPTGSLMALNRNILNEKFLINLALAQVLESQKWQTLKNRLLNILMYCLFSILIANLTINENKIWQSIAEAICAVREFTVVFAYPALVYFNITPMSHR